MGDKFVADRKFMEHIVREIKKLDLCNYDDYVRVVGIVGMIESIMNSCNQSQPEEVKANG